MRVVPPTEAGIAVVVEALRAGKVVAYPTETVYGLGANPHDVDALEMLFRGKARSARKAVLVIVDDIPQLDGLVMTISPTAQRYTDRFWPGPLSLLLPAIPGLPEHLTGPQGKICVRCPACDIARSICREFGGAITSTSANSAGEKPARAVLDIDLPGVDVAVDGGVLPESPPSTIFDPDTGQILRHGAIPETDLRAFA